MIFLGLVEIMKIKRVWQIFKKRNGYIFRGSFAGAERDFYMFWEKKWDPLTPRNGIFLVSP